MDTFRLFSVYPWMSISWSCACFRMSSKTWPIFIPLWLIVDIRMDPSDFVVGRCPKNWLLSVVSSWNGSEDLLDVGSMLNFFGRLVGIGRLVDGMLNFSVVAMIVVNGVGSEIGSMLNFSVGLVESMAI